MSVEAAPPALIRLSGIKALLLTPQAAWAKIDAEAASARAIFIGYVLPLAAVTPLCIAVGRLTFGERVLGAIYRPPFLAAGIEAVISYGLILASVWALAGLITLLAAPFGAEKNGAAAFRIAAYSGTAGWIAGAVYLIPPLGALALVGQIYTLYLLYTGVRILLRPRSRTFGYVALVVVCHIVLMLLAISLAKLLAAAV